jgi:hypothetical protein
MEIKSRIMSLMRTVAWKRKDERILKEGDNVEDLDVCR